MFKLNRRKDGFYFLEVNKWIDSVGHNGQEVSFIPLSPQEFQELYELIEFERLTKPLTNGGRVSK